MFLFISIYATRKEKMRATQLPTHRAKAKMRKAKRIAELKKARKERKGN